MKSIYSVKGMSCEGCATKVKGALAGVEGVQAVSVDLAGATITVVSRSEISFDVLYEAVGKAGGYRLTTGERKKAHAGIFKEIKKFAPLILMFGIVIAYTVAVQVVHGFGFHKTMIDFMG